MHTNPTHCVAKPLCGSSNLCVAMTKKLSIAMAIITTRARKENIKVN